MLPLYEVRYKQGSRFLSRQFLTPKAEYAVKSAQRLGRVLSVKEKKPWEIIGLVENMDLQQQTIAFGSGSDSKSVVESNPILAEQTLEGILFPKKKGTRRFNDGERAVRESKLREHAPDDEGQQEI
jgi:hypothetical protein